jgi:hypothetical protein
MHLRRCCGSTLCARREGAVPDKDWQKRRAGRIRQHHGDGPQASDARRPLQMSARDPQAGAGCYLRIVVRVAASETARLMSVSMSMLSSAMACEGVDGGDGTSDEGDGRGKSERPRVISNLHIAHTRHSREPVSISTTTLVYSSSPAHERRRMGQARRRRATLFRRQLQQTHTSR